LVVVNTRLLAIVAPILCMSLTLSGPALAGQPLASLAPAEGEAGEGQDAGAPAPEPEVSPEDEEKAKSLYAQAEKLAKKKKWKDAVELYEQAYYLVPGKHGFAHKVGAAAFEAGDCEKALQYMLHFLTYAEGEQYEDKRAEARDVLTKMLEKGCVTEEQVGNANLSEEQKEEKARDLYSQAEALAAEAKWSEAVVLYEQAYYLVPSKVGFAHKVGLAAYEAKECDKAHQYLVFFIEYADPNKYADRMDEATKLVRELENSGCVSGTEMEEHQLENPFEIDPDENRKTDDGKRKGGKGLLIGGSALLVLGVGGVAVGAVGMVMAGSSQSKLDGLASTDTVSGYPDGDYACRNVASDQCPPQLEDQIATRQLLGIIGLAAGGALLVTGVALIAVYGAKNKRGGGGRHARLDAIGPSYMPGGMGVTASLRF